MRSAGGLPGGGAPACPPRQAGLHRSIPPLRCDVSAAAARRGEASTSQPPAARVDPPPPPLPASSPIEPGAAAALTSLGLAPSAASRLLRKVAKLKAGPHGRDDGSSGSSGSGSGGSGARGPDPLASSDWSSGGESEGGGDGGRRQRPPAGLPDRGVVEATANALLGIGLRVRDLASILERAPGLLALPPGVLAGRAANLRAAWGLGAGASLDLIRFRPALLCSRGARRRLRATLAALTAPDASNPSLTGLTGRQLGSVVDRCPAALWVPPAQVDGAWAALVPEMKARSRTESPSTVTQEAVSAAAAAIARHPTALLLHGGARRAAERVEAELVGAGVPSPVAAAAVAGAGAAALAAAPPGHGAAVPDALRSAGLDEATVAAALTAAPGALLGARSAAVVELKARLAVEMLGAPPAALAYAPAAKVLFRKDVGATTGPRFAFVRELLDARTEKGRGDGRWVRSAQPPPSPSPSSSSGRRLLDKGRQAAPGVVSPVPDEGGDGEPRPPHAVSFPIDSPPPATPRAAGRRLAAILRGTDAAFASGWAGVTPSEFLVFKWRWQDEVLPGLGPGVARPIRAGRRLAAPPGGAPGAPTAKRR